MEIEVKSNQKTPIILIVDDYAINLKVLGDILKNAGYEVRPVPSGMLALQVAEKEKPDLILLDILMPDMDGYEVCRLLKTNDNLKDVPIIFISALNDTKDIVKAFTEGGADYITKPFQSEEVKARVAIHLKLYQQSKELLELNATKDKFFSVIAHDLRGPLGGLMGLAEMMDDDSFKFTPEEEKDLRQTLSLSARNTFNLLENLLEWSQMQRGHTPFKPQILPLKEAVGECVEQLSESIRKKSVSVNIDIVDTQKVYADKNMLQSVIRNIVSNSVKFSSRGGVIKISVESTNRNEIIMLISDDGVGMNAKLLQNLFNLNANVNRSGTEGEPSTGLGLIICKDFIEKHGGRIWADSTEQCGCVFRFTLPNKI